MKMSLRMILMWTGVVSLLLVITQRVFASGTAASVVLSPAFSSFALFGAGACAAVLSLVQRSYREIKPIIDLAFAVVLFAALAPLMLVVAVAVKLTSRGPVFFTQVRVGENRRRTRGDLNVGKGGRRVADHCGRLFTVYKFRTMYVHSESASGPVWAKQNDPRITPLGRFLRKSHLDELPQLFNVLKSEMSLVGPRPERPFFVQRFKDSVKGYCSRLVVRPGITGLAQIRHKADETVDDVEQKIAYDRLYVTRQCLFLDIIILFETIRVAILGKPSTRRNSRSGGPLRRGARLQELRRN
jgi:lipopolysaccharide/colanic/teichoic acid biosynthesis glycosyltransferase